MSDQIWSSWVWPAATAVLSFVYTALLLRQYLRRRKMHQLMWAIGFLFYAVAALMEMISEYQGFWDPSVYRVYIVLAASLVGFLGNGSLYLTSRKRLWGDIYLGFNLVMLAVFLYGTLTVHLDVALLKALPGVVVGGQALGSQLSFPRVMSLVFNIPGSLFLIGGSLLSIWRFRANPAFRYRVWANVLILVGTFIIAGTGGMARAGNTRGLYLAEMVASAILLAGFLLAGTLDKGAQAAIASAHARDEAKAIASAVAGEIKGEKPKG